MSDGPRIIPMLLPEPNAEETAFARESQEYFGINADLLAEHDSRIRAAAFRLGIEWAAKQVLYFLSPNMSETAVGRIADLLAAHDAAMKGQTAITERGK